MRNVIIVALLVIVASLIAREVTNPVASACSDYLVIGRTFEKCITDKNIHE